MTESVCGSRNHSSHLRRKYTLLSFFCVLGLSALCTWTISHRLQRPAVSRLLLHNEEVLSKCRALDLKPGPPNNFHSRTESDRYDPRHTTTTLIRNGTIWTGGQNGSEVIHGDILLDKGIIIAVGKVEPGLLQIYQDVVTVDAHGGWVSPGVVDLHSHIGVGPSPALSGASDGNSIKGPVLAWLRSIDGLNTRDESYRLAVAGGVTTSLILPGSANAIGGQAFVIKLRPSSDRSPSGLLLEPPYGLNGSEVDLNLPPRWRHMKHACGENPSRTYSATRMDTMWAFRQAYQHAHDIKKSQDEYCRKAFSGELLDLETFPEDLQWEALVDVLRGRVKVQTHCYEAVDIDAFVRVANEFEFPIAAFHHAHEAYLVPDVLKKAQGDPPAIAMFASFSIYKREAYRHSEFAPRVLAENGIKVVMKSDHPAIHSRYLLHEAQQAHFYGLPDNVALSSVITTPAEVLGLGHRIGYLATGFDADLVIWDRHPLALGATPRQVFIDGIPQLDSSIAPHHVTNLGPPSTPNFDREAADAVAYDGLPPLHPRNPRKDLVVFVNVTDAWTRDFNGTRNLMDGQTEPGVVAAERGRIICAGSAMSCAPQLARPDAVVVDLEGGSLSPALVSFGSQLGMQEIAMEASTTDGSAIDAMTEIVPPLLAGNEVVKAIDGIAFDSRDALLAYRAGVTRAIVAPAANGFIQGLSAGFSLGSRNKLGRGAVIQEIAALHVSLGHGRAFPSVSTQVAALRRLLLGGDRSGDTASWFRKAATGAIPLVVEVHDADIIATLLLLKKEVEGVTNATIRMSLLGATEAHILAKEISSANVGVLLTPPRSHPYTWERRRIHAGPPLTHDSLISYLFANNVTIGIGPQGVEGSSALSGWAVRNLRFDAAWALEDSAGKITKECVLAMATSNVERLFGLTGDPGEADIIATRGGELLSLEGKVVAVLSPSREIVDVL
ncbi:hypothetical protein JAAARDRAFT_267221 [Jaapia argillacea MUCL 33604]|uniref:Amidohydrolase-related domain-containing protein n=1 Tax=Jaapia argillacea MUCL 33604 TaxID=933084 RepID=A0A067PRT4_9AGAM|nr:hypothetical protein JAAARDRAFT_267221 [Jaapia argillacea MUCL 33604]